ncbi:MAG: hypothetical protein ACAH11_08780 [Sphingomonas sp.]
MKLLALVLSALAVLALPAAPAFAQGERIVAPAGGISIEKPRGWNILPPDEAMENLRGLRFDDPRVQRAIGSGNAPFIVLLKYPADTEGINPTLKVNYRPLPPSLRGKSAVEVLSMLFESMRTTVNDVVLLDPPAPVQFAGGTGAHFRLSYTLVGSAGTPYKVISEMWMTLRGDYAVILGAGYGADEPPATAAEIAAASRTFRLEGDGPPQR